MHATDKVNGIVILNTNDSHFPDHYSPDYRCPDSQYGRNLFVQLSLDTVWSWCR